MAECVWMVECVWTVCVKEDDGGSFRVDTSKTVTRRVHVCDQQ